ncbi:MAG: phospholipid carrier-dependent glycosyltransferase [Christensenellales bacterium]
MRKFSALFVSALIIFFGFSTNAFAQTNLLANSSFEDSAGSLNNWDTGVWEENEYLNIFEISKDAYDGFYSAHIQSKSSNDIRLEQTVAVEPDTNYRLSGYIKAAGCSPKGTGATLSFLDTFVATEDLKDTAGEWKYVEIYVYTGGKQTETTITARIGFYGSTNTGEAWFDQIIFKKVDAPAAGTTLRDITPVKNNEPAKNTEEEQFEPSLIPLFVLIAAAFVYAVYFIYQRRLKTEFSLHVERESNNTLLLWILFIGIVLRLILAVKFEGYPTDIGCFKGWSNLAYEKGLAEFYHTPVFTDYPPGYMYILYAVGFIKNVLGIANDSAIFTLLLKLPSILCDILSAALVYRYAKKHCNKNVATLLFAIMVLNPAYFVNTAVWAQIDSLFTLILVLSFYLFEQDKKVLASMVYGLAVLVKPQALLFGPIILLPFISEIIKDWKKGLLKAALCGAAALLVIYVFSLPFGFAHEGLSPSWLVDKYFKTATSYEYATLNAPNLFALTGNNWVGVKKEWFLFSFQDWGTFFMILSIAASMAFYLFKRKKSNIYLTAALLVTGIFMLGHYMHERYIFPVLLLLMLAYISTRDKRLLAIFTGFSATLTINLLYILAYGHFDRWNPNNISLSAVLLMVLAAINLALFAWLIKVCIDHFRKRTADPAQNGIENIADTAEPVNLPIVEHPNSTPVQVLYYKENDVPPIEMPGDPKLRFSRKDALWLGVLVAVYTVFAFINLGSTQVPQTYWRSESIGSTIDVSFDTMHKVTEIRYYGGVGSGTLDISQKESDGSYTFIESIKQDQGNMYNWVVVPLEFEASEIRLEISVSGLWLHEIVFMDENGVIPTGSVVYSDQYTIPDSKAENLFDEQSLAAVPSYMTGMYFDEVYHARTAYEHLKGISPYENSHPPLGKIFIMVGVWIFGMNPFGWRIVGTLFGIGMIPLMYCFGLRLFKKRKYAFMAASLFAFDFMHFTQTRIATIDVYGVFFIIAMLYYMYKFYLTNFNVQPLKKVLLPLGTAGVLFGIGAASKWICLYVGAGLAVMFAVYMVKRYREYRYACDTLDSNAEISPELTDQLQAIENSFIRKTILILLFCVLFFIIIPVLIYVASYLPYLLVESGKKYDLEGVWGLQEFMFNYHSKLTASHPYSSQWWQWPVMDRPVWYYMGTHLKENMVAGISAFGNPAVWLTGIGAFVFMLVASAKRKLEKSPGIFLVFTGLATNFLPWVLVTRATFLYHYFATIPFLVFAIVYLFKYIEERKGWPEAIRWGYLILVFVLFVLFYPLLSGMTIPKDYAMLFRWWPNWVLFSG